MKKILFLAAVLSVILSSCIKDSDWGKITIPAEQKLTFSEPVEPYEERPIIILINKQDTMFIKNMNVIYRICYLRAAFPDKGIVLDYVRTKEDNKIVFETRFINLQK